MCLDSIDAYGGGDDPEDGLEALAYAINSEWTTQHARTRRAIVIWSDAVPHALGHGKSSQYYPRGMAKDIRELEAWWDALAEKYFSAIFLFTPDEGDWGYISRNWDNIIHYPSAAGEGLSERSYWEILNVLQDPP